MTELVVQDLMKRFGAQTVLDGVDLRVPGGVTALLGPSGCGKTTLLRVVAGFLTPDAGRVAVGGTILTDGRRVTSPRRRGVGYVPQEGALFPHLNVEGNIGFGLGSAADREVRVGVVMELVGLPSGLRSRYPHELSGGQQQRVALARALAPRPRVVLLDEPFSSLDVGLRQAAGEDVVSALHRADTTAVLVTHDQDEALSLADRVAVMLDGRVRQVGTPSDLYISPVDPEVGLFVGGGRLVDGVVHNGIADTALGAIPVHPADLSGPVQVLVRPEQVEVWPRASAPTGTSAVAQVVRVAYHGRDTSVRLHLIPAGPTVDARVPARGDLHPGADVALRVTERAAAFPAPGPAEVHR